MAYKRKITVVSLKPQQKRLYEALGQEPPKPVHPQLALLFGYPLALIINQLLFWQGRGIKHKGGYIYKTEKDFKKEIGATPAQQRGAIRKGKQFGFLIVDRKSVPAKRHYMLNFDMLVRAILSEAKKKDVAVLKQDLEKLLINSTNTEITQENTARKKGMSSAGDILDSKFKK